MTEPHCLVAIGKLEPDLFQDCFVVIGKWFLEGNTARAKAARKTSQKRPAIRDGHQV
jgi:hypothetical protein